MMLPIDTEVLMPSNDPVILASAQLEELDCSKLYRAYSPKGRKSATEPRIIFKVLGLRLHERDIFKQEARNGLPEEYRLHVAVGGRTGAGS